MLKLQSADEYIFGHRSYGVAREMLVYMLLFSLKFFFLHDEKQHLIVLGMNCKQIYRSFFFDLTIFAVQRQVRTEETMLTIRFVFALQIIA